jgi:FkbM family methyltransferase
MIPQRFHLPLRWFQARLQGQAAHVPFSDIVHHLFSAPWKQRAERWLDRVEEEPTGEFFKVYLKGRSEPLFWPKSQHLDGFLSLLAEQEPSHWHYYQIPETRVQSGDVVADCGASEGFFAFLALPVATRILAVEPTRGFQRCLSQTFAPFPQVTLVDCALGREPGTVRFPESSLGARAVENGEIEVQVRTLDEVAETLKTPIHYIKADVEGAEPDLLAGARETIFQNKPRIAITTYHQADHAETLTRFLREIHPRYHIRWKGLSGDGYPTLLHAWMD